MKNVSENYKVAIDKDMRNAGYVKVVIGVISKGVQTGCKIVGEVGNEYMWWSNIDEAFNSDMPSGRNYATLEEDFLRCDGKQFFLPDENKLAKDNTYCIVTTSLLGDVNIAFTDIYDVKGITIEFEDTYPTKLQITTDNADVTFDNDSATFETVASLGENLSFMKIHPIEMVGGEQRMRIKQITFGARLTFTNSDVSSSSVAQYVSPLSEETSSTSLSLEVLDYTDNYNVDSVNAYTNYLETGQMVQVNYGIATDEGEIEWVEAENLQLSSWNAMFGKMSFIARDKFNFWTDQYQTATSATIHERTVYQDIYDLLIDVGLTEDEFVIDELLKNVTITNPLPENTHAEILQLLCNASRSVFFQDNLGRVIVRTNYVNDKSSEYINDYTLVKKDFMEHVMGFSEEKVKSVRVRIVTFENDSAGNPSQTNDEVYVERKLSTNGSIVTYENQLISTEELANDMLDWLCSYYNQLIQYDVEHRGDIRLDAGDTIKMESDYLENLYVDIVENNFTFDGAFRGSMTLNRSLRAVSK